MRNVKRVEAINQTLTDELSQAESLECNLTYCIICNKLESGKKASQYKTNSNYLLYLKLNKQEKKFNISTSRLFVPAFSH